MVTQRNIKRLVKRANSVLVNDIEFNIAAFHLGRNFSGPMLKLSRASGEASPATDTWFTMEELTTAEVLGDNETLVIRVSGDRLVFLQKKPMKVNVSN